MRLLWLDQFLVGRWWGICSYFFGGRRGDCKSSPCRHQLSRSAASGCQAPGVPCMLKCLRVLGGPEGAPRLSLQEDVEGGGLRSGGEWRGRERDTCVTLGWLTSTSPASGENLPTDSSPQTDSLTESDPRWDSFPPLLSPPSRGPHCWLTRQL